MQKVGQLVDFRIKSTLGVTLITLLILTPFTMNNFLEGRYVLGIGSLSIVLLCAVNAWNCIQRRYYPSLISLVLVPAITVFLIFAFRQQGAMISYWC